jgi:hypothetical protein
MYHPSLLEKARYFHQSRPLVPSLAHPIQSQEVPAPQPPHSTHFVEELDSDSEDGPQAKDKGGLRRRKTPRASLMEVRFLGFVAIFFVLAGVVKQGCTALLQEVPAEETTKPDKKWLDDYVNRTKFFQGTDTPDLADGQIVPE